MTGSEDLGGDLMALVKRGPGVNPEDVRGELAGRLAVMLMVVINAETGCRVKWIGRAV
jgi:hypothetical protein